MSDGKLLDPTARLERTLKLRVKGHQLVLLRWWPETEPGKGEREEEYGARPATIQEDAMWRRLVILEGMANRATMERARLEAALEATGEARDRLIAELESARAVVARRPGPTHAEEAEPRRG